MIAMPRGMAEAAAYGQPHAADAAVTARAADAGSLPAFARCGRFQGQLASLRMGEEDVHADACSQRKAKEL
jgi:hypothetical protein